jgi:hypothetical protein
MNEPVPAGLYSSPTPYRTSNIFAVEDKRPQSGRSQKSRNYVDDQNKSQRPHTVNLGKTLGLQYNRK